MTAFSLQQWYSRVFFPTWNRKTQGHFSRNSAPFLQKLSKFPKTQKYEKSDFRWRNSASKLGFFTKFLMIFGSLLAFFSIFWVFWINFNPFFSENWWYFEFFSKIFEKLKIFKGKLKYFWKTQEKVQKLNFKSCENSKIRKIAVHQLNKSGKKIPAIYPGI